VNAKRIKTLYSISQNSCDGVIYKCKDCPLREMLNVSPENKSYQLFKCMMNSKEYAKEELLKYTEEELFDELI